MRIRYNCPENGNVLKKTTNGDDMKGRKLITAVLTVILLLSCVSVAACGSDTEEEGAFEPTTYTITFDYGDGTGTETTRTVEYRSEVKNLPAPTATPAGKIFAGWTMEDGKVFAEGTRYTFKNDIKLTAAYSDEQYTIVYDVADGDPLPADAITTYSLSATDIILPTPTKENCDFKGWLEDGATETVLVIAAGSTGNKSFTAVWETHKIRVNFDNTSKANYTKWKDDGETGYAYVDVGGTLTSFPAMRYDDLTSDAKNNETYAFKGWFYKDKDNVEHKLELTTVFTLESLNIASNEFTAYVKVSKQWAGPY